MTDAEEIGKYHKLWFYISSGLASLLDIAIIVSLFFFFNFGTLYLGIGAGCLLLRIAIAALNWRTARFAPMETEYRVTLLEDKVYGIEKKMPLRTVEVPSGES
ncbi:MAG: hypothetical protein PHY47_00630 [Lachnospiraceae bacterium]|nr:hypothetical protein [Lachnospiraceae bacterium]